MTVANIVIVRLESADRPSVQRNITMKEMVVCTLNRLVTAIMTEENLRLKLKSGVMVLVHANAPLQHDTVR